jgi:hypothetical protein
MAAPFDLQIDRFDRYFQSSTNLRFVEAYDFEVYKITSQSLTALFMSTQNSLTPTFETGNTRSDGMPGYLARLVRLQETFVMNLLLIHDLESSKRSQRRTSGVVRICLKLSS